jgi:hypothetical protein
VDRPLYVAVVGSGGATGELYKKAREVTARRFQRRHRRLRRPLGRNGSCGARSDRGGGVAIGILPDEDRRLANPYVSYSLPTGTGQARNLAVICSGDTVVAVGGEYGTLSEIGLALKIRRPVVALESWNLGGHVVVAALPEKSVEKALRAVRVSD